MLTALSLFIPYLLGLGSLLLPLYPRLFVEPPSDTRARAGMLALVLAFGIAVNYLVVLICADVGVALMAGGILSLCGTGYAMLRLRARLAAFFGLGWVLWGAFIYLLVLYSLPILLSPLSEWDARSIWFFHGKMIYYAHALSHATGLDKEAVQFSHTDYPMLVPVLAAQFAYVAGYWNEYLPKAGLLALLVPALLGLLSFFNGRRVSSYFLVAAFLFSLGWLLWDGYMDGYLALYAGLSLLFCGRWTRDGAPRDLAAGVLFLGVAINLKNEGTLFALSTLCSLLVFLALARRSLHRAPATRLTWKFWAAAAVPFLCTLMWAGKKASWGLANDLQLGTRSLPRISMHIAEGGIGKIGTFLLEDALVGKAALFLLAGVIAAKCLRVRLSSSVWFSVTTSVLYFAGMYLVYLATPWDLMTHLTSSAARTMGTVILGFFAATFFALQDMEEPR